MALLVISLLDVLMVAVFVSGTFVIRGWFRVYIAKRKEGKLSLDRYSVQVRHTS